MPKIGPISFDLLVFDWAIVETRDAGFLWSQHSRYFAFGTRNQSTLLRVGICALLNSFACTIEYSISKFECCVIYIYIWLCYWENFITKPQILTTHIKNYVCLEKNYDRKLQRITVYVWTKYPEPSISG